MATYFLSVTDDKMEYSATLQCYFSFNIIILFISHLLMGNVNMQVVEYSGIALIGLAFVTLAGFSLFKKLSIEKIKIMVYAFMVLFGVYLLIMG